MQRSVPENTVTLGRPPILTLEVKRRLYPDLNDYWEGNWLGVNLTVAAGRFRGFFEAQRRAEELVELRATLQDMYKRLCGGWHQAFMEPWLDLHFKGDGLGHFHTVCVAEDMPGMGNKLTFDIDFDQTEVPDLLASMDGIVSNFPVRGAPRRTNK